MADDSAVGGGPEGRDDAPSFSVIDRRPRYEDGEPGPEEGAPEARLPSVVEELKARAEEAEKRAREISAAYRKIDAERDAFRERLSRDLERRVDIARGDLMRRIVPILDDLDRALAAARSAAEPGSLIEGVSIVRDRLRQALAAEGVEDVETEGHPFDPAVAEAVEIVETSEPSRDNLVVQELERGYRLGATLLRPARVRVARLKRETPGADPEPPAS